MRETVRVCAPRYLQIGRGSVAGIADLVKAVGPVRSPLIITDKTMVGLGHLAYVQEHLAGGGFTCAVFDGTAPDPTDEVVLSALSVLESGGHDCVIGVGGGSPIDTAKAVAVMARHSRNVLDYRPPGEFNAPGLPMIAVPTTAGTGSEITHHTVLVHAATREKISCRGEAFVPTAAVIDYTFTLSKPKRLTADNALDTLTHGIEAYVSKKRSMFSDRMALDCMRLVGQFLERAYTDGSDCEAREGLMLSATMGGLAFSNASICLVHAMSRPLGSLFHVPHGLSNAMLLPVVTAWSEPSATARYATCGRTIGFAEHADDDETAAHKLIDGLFGFTQKLDVPSMEAFGIRRDAFVDAIDQMADDALRSGAPGLNPRVPTRGEIAELYHLAWKGDK